MSVTTTVTSLYKVTNQSIVNNFKSCPLKLKNNLRNVFLTYGINFLLVYHEINYILASIVNCKILPNYVASIISRKYSETQLKCFSDNLIPRW